MRTAGALLFAGAIAAGRAANPPYPRWKIVDAVGDMSGTVGDYSTPHRARQHWHSMNTAVTELIRSQVAAAVTQARAVSAVQHPGLRGQLREIIARQLLHPLLPPGLGIGTGEIVSAYNDHSPQVDLVIYDRSIAPPMLVGQDYGVFPIEAAIAAIEIKSVLTATDLKDADDAARRIRRMPFSPALGGQTHQPYVVLPALFALESDLAQGGMDEITRYGNHGANDGGGLLEICVVGRGHWFVDAHQWHLRVHPGQYGEVLGFLGALLNRLPDFRQSRRSPDYRNYLG